MDQYQDHADLGENAITSLQVRRNTNQYERQYSESLGRSRNLQLSSERQTNVENNPFISTGHSPPEHRRGMLSHVQACDSESRRITGSQSMQLQLRGGILSHAQTSNVGHHQARPRNGRRRQGESILSPTQISDHESHQIGSSEPRQRLHHRNVLSGTSNRGPIRRSARSSNQRRPSSVLAEDRVGHENSRSQRTRDSQTNSSTTRYPFRWRLINDRRARLDASRVLPHQNRHNIYAQQLALGAQENCEANTAKKRKRRANETVDRELLESSRMQELAKIR